MERLMGYEVAYQMRSRKKIKQTEKNQNQIVEQIRIDLSQIISIKEYYSKRIKTQKTLLETEIIIRKLNLMKELSQLLFMHQFLLESIEV